MAADTLKEFLVTLGFKVNDTYKAFKDSVKQATSAVTTLGAETVAAATEISYMVNKVSKDYEELYYISQRSGAAVSGIKGLGYAGKQVGVAYEESKAAIESFGRAVRMDPGLGAMLRAQGIQTKDAEKGLVSYIQRQKKTFGERGYFAAADQAQQLFGISEQTFRQFWVNMDKTLAKRKEHTKMLKDAGFDADAAAPKFLEFSNNVETLWDRLGILKDRIAHDFLPAGNKMVKWADDMLVRFSKFNEGHGGAPGEAAAVVAAFTPMLLFKKFRGLMGKAAFGGGPLGLALDAAMMMKGDTDNSTRSWLRSWGEPLGYKESEEDKKEQPSWRTNQPKSFGDWWSRRPSGLTGGTSMQPFSLGDIASALAPGGAQAGVIAPTIHQETKISILPGSTAWDTAQAVFGAQDDINSNLVRYMGRQFVQ